MTKTTMALIIATVMVAVNSCVPLTPSVNIYNSINTTPDKTQIVTCQSGTYVLPAKPDLSDLDDGDDKGVVNRLNSHIEVLRAELRSLASKGTCPK